jgi:hypothetical protein
MQISVLLNCFRNNDKKKMSEIFSEYFQSTVSQINRCRIHDREGSILPHEFSQLRYISQSLLLEIEVIITKFSLFENNFQRMLFVKVGFLIPGTLSYD